jgi:hypothetical protein
MRVVLAAVCAFTLLACAWLLAVFFVLRHPGFEWQAVVSALLIAQSAATLVVLGPGVRALWPRIALALGACAIVAVGALAFVANEQASDWEGYVAVISAALVLQGLLTLPATFSPPARG